MKKIGIVTYYSIYNYGSVLQAYALINTVQSLGYRAELINYNDMSKTHNIITRLSTYKNRFFCCIGRPVLLYETLSRKKVGNRSISARSDDLKQKFDSFIKENLNLTNANYRNAKKSGFSAFICGSDQVWQLNAAGLHEMFFLRFAPKYMRIAYAPSFGGTTIPEYNKRRLKKYLNEIPYISTREDTGVDVVMNSTGRNVQTVLDPVLLVGKNFWEVEIKAVPVKKSSYLACYFLSDASAAYKSIDNLCEQYNLEVIWITSGKPLTDRDYRQYDASPLEFVSIIKNAKFVYTDSLHGTEFAILLQIPFYVFDRKYEVVPEQNTRIDSLLRMTCLKERLIRNGFDVDIDNAMNIDFKKAEEGIRAVKETSMNFLQTSLSNANKIDGKEAKNND